MVCCLPAWKPLWKGLRDLFRMRTGTYTVAVFSVVVVILYDFASLYMANHRLPPAFHFAAAWNLVAATVADHLLLCREKRTFRVYSAEGTAYTLLKSEGNGSIAEKMYRGGLPRTHAVRTLADVPFPNCYFRAVCEETASHSVMRYLSVPLLILSALCGVGCALFGEDIFSAVSASLMVLMAAIPSSAILVNKSMWA